MQAHIFQHVAEIAGKPLSEISITTLSHLCANREFEEQLAACEAVYFFPQG